MPCPTCGASLLGDVDPVFARKFPNWKDLPSEALAQQYALWLAAKTADASSRCLRTTFELLGKPHSLLDVGCGDGHLVDLAVSMGVLSLGVDLLAPNRPNLKVWNLGKPLYVEQAEMVLCWEVAEHLPSGHAPVLCQSLARAVEPNGWLLFTAAIPGQGGAGHQNEQPHRYWREKLQFLGLTWEEEWSRRMSHHWSVAAPEAWWYGQNLQIFRKL